MSDARELAAQSLDEARQAGLAAYGVGGDFTGARRARRAFRLCVLAVLASTSALYFAENFLRYDLVETQYLRALTLEDDSQRAILHNVVARDRETPTPQSQRYLEALAAIEEEDLILPRYEEAYQLNPKNQPLIISFGCRLFLDSQYRRARDSFREASLIQPPRNALPRYLEASALVAGDDAESTLREAMSLVARANAAGDPLLFPQPLWHESLPTESRWHARKQQEAADLCCAPLYRFKSLVLNQARTAIEAGQFADWESWLRDLEGMGRRLVGQAGGDSAHHTTSRTQAGLQFMHDALAMRKALHLARGSASDQAALRELAAGGIENKIAAAWETLRAFDQEREIAIDAHEQWVVAPLRLAARTVAILSAVWLCSVLLCRVFTTDRAAWAVPHHRTGISVIVGGAVILFVYLLGISMARHTDTSDHAWPQVLLAAWYAPVFAWLFFGVCYPFIALPLPASVLRDLKEPVDAALVRARHRDAVLVLARRYFAVLLGTFLMVLATWSITHRLLYERYPTDKKLLCTGLRAEELAVLGTIRDSLR